MRTVPVEAVSRSVEETRRLGKELALVAAPGTLVRLSGALGAGKTELVRGLAEGLGADPEEVSSPTFALVHEYGPPGQAPLLVHADLYRLPEGERSASAAGDLGLDEARARGAVVAVEWPEGLPPGGGELDVTILLEDDGARRILVRRAPDAALERSGLRTRR